jgi:hypothetical protein
MRDVSVISTALAGRMSDRSSRANGGNFVQILVISHERHWVFSSGPILACVSWIRMAIGVDAKISDGFTLQPPTEVNLFVGWQVGSREIVKVDPLVVRMCWCDEKKYLRVADILCELVVY